MQEIWMLYVHRPVEWEIDFAGVFTTVDIELLRSIGPNHKWKFEKDSICGWNPKWVDGPEFMFHLRPVNTYFPPAHLV